MIDSLSGGGLTPTFADEQGAYKQRGAGRSWQMANMPDLLTAGAWKIPNEILWIAFDGGLETWAYPLIASRPRYPRGAILSAETIPNVPLQFRLFDHCILTFFKQH